MFSLNKITSKEGFLFLKKDENQREIKIFELHNVITVGNSIYYPDVKLYSYTENKVYNPINEKIMSLDSLKHEEYVDFEIKDQNKFETNNQNLFYFIYNTDNYYHFLYDTLPYLISYFELKKKIKDIKLLINYPNKKAEKIYNFVKEFLSLLGINDEDYVYIKTNLLYKNLYISDSFTHGIDSNISPRKEIYELYSTIKQSVPETEKKFPTKIYVSRRSWKHNDTSNIGTNYTTRRNLINETELVSVLEENGYTEVFTELLTTDEKIQMFRNATHVIGAIGGGVSNVLFSNNECKLICICSPNFLDFNKRFLFCFKNIKSYLFTDTEHESKNKYKKFMRVKFGKIVGEVIDVNEKTITIMYTDEILAGWNSELEYKTIIAPINECTALDYGLNSSWKVNIELLKKIL